MFNFCKTQDLAGNVHYINPASVVSIQISTNEAQSVIVTLSNCEEVYLDRLRGYQLCAWLGLHPEADA